MWYVDISLFFFQTKAALRSRISARDCKRVFSCSKSGYSYQNGQPTTPGGGGGDRAPESERAVDRRHGILNESATASQQDPTHTIKPHAKCGNICGPDFLGSPFYHVKSADRKSTRLNSSH